MPTPTRSFEKAWLAHCFARELVPIYPVYAIMMGEQGIAPFQLSLLFVFWSATVVVLEVPSGTLGDRMSRQHLLVVSGLIKACCFPLWLLFPHFLGYLAGFVCWGLGSSLRSGTAESLLHDTLATSGPTERFAKVYGRGKAAEMLGVGTALLAGGWLAESGYRWPLVLSALGPIAAALIAALAFAEPPRTGANQRGQVDSYFGSMRSGLREARSSPTLRSLIVLVATAMTVSGVLDEYVGPVLHDKGTLSLAAIGLVFATIAAAGGLASALAHRIRVRSVAGISRLLVAAAPLLVVAAWSPGWLAGAALIAYFALCAGGQVLLDARIQETIRGRSRATITSLSGFTQECFGMLLYLLVGAVAGAAGWSGGLLALAAVQVLSSLPTALRGSSRSAPQSE